MLKRLLLFACLPALLVAQKVEYKRTEDVIYGRKWGTALTLDVFQPAKPTGFGIVFVISAGWVSSREAIDTPLFRQVYEAFILRGYTVFAVVPGSQPKFQIPEMNADVHRAVRFVRSNAAKYDVDPDHLGISGGSAGCHLSLLAATQGKTGETDAKDPTDRASSAVQAVACFFPPTDFLNYGAPGEDAVGVGTLKNFKSAFGPRSETAESRKAYGKEISPIEFISASMPPVLLIHGDADKLVPLQQSEMFLAKAQEAGVKTKLVIKKDAAHSWPDLAADVPLMADWFDQYLRGITN